MNFNTLPFNKTCIFKPTIDSGKTTLVRTGTMKETEGDGVISFFNSCVHACSDNFIYLSSEKEKFKHINSVKASVIEDIQSGSFGFVKETIFYLLRDFYYYLVSEEIKNDNVKEVIDKLENDIEFYKLLVEIIPFDAGFIKIMKNTNKKFSKYFPDSYKKTFKKETYKFLDYQDIFDSIGKERTDFIISKVSILIDIIFSVVDKTYEVPNLDFISDDLIMATSKYFKCNIFFIDVESNEPFMFNTDEQTKSIVLLSFKRKHFEIVGKLLENNRIQRDFSLKEDFIVNLYRKIKSDDSINEEINTHVEQQVDGESVKHVAAEEESVKHVVDEEEHVDNESVKHDEPVDGERDDTDEPEDGESVKPVEEEISTHHDI